MDMTNKGMFTSNDSTWTTPLDFFNKLDAEFNFGLDAAALSNSALCDNWYGPDHPNLNKRDCLTIEWDKEQTVWLNPPYGRIIGKFMAKAFEQNRGGQQWYV
jgi:phage N-6-adenine-methyltransferase